VDHTALVELLHSDWAADAACRQALLDGAPFEIWEHGPTPVDRLVHIYGLRERHTRQKGIPSIGFSDAVTRLQACGLDAVLIGYVKDVEHRRHFQLFVATDQSHVVSCLGVDQPGA
jgi:hypothetical protein